MGGTSERNMGVGRDVRPALTTTDRLIGVARSINALEQRLEVLKARVAQFAVKLARVVR